MKTLLIGIGNEFRGDDGAGLAIARRVKEQKPPGVEIHEAAGEALALMELWQDAERLFLVDALEAGETPGTIFRFDASRESLPSTIVPCSTHSFSLTEALELARTLDRLPKEVIVYGIQGKQFGQGPGLSPSIERKLDELVRQILDELSN